MTVLREGLDLAVPHAEELFIGGSWQQPATADRFAVVHVRNDAAPQVQAVIEPPVLRR